MTSPETPQTDEPITIVEPEVVNALIVSCVADLIIMSSNLLKAGKDMEAGGPLNKDALVNDITRIAAATAVLNALGLVNNVAATRIVQEKLMAVMPPKGDANRPN